MTDDDALAFNDPCSSNGGSVCKFLLQVPSGGEVFVSCGVFECRISDPSSRGEIICRGAGGATWHGRAVWAIPTSTDGR
jgi:hypothetical protein